MPFTYPYPRPAVTCDVVAFTIRGGELAVLLVQRKDEPFRGRWALPGGFVNEGEALERAAARELYEETGVSGVRLEQVGAYGDPGRDPRGHTVSVAYVTFLVAEATITAGDDAAAAEWRPFKGLALHELPPAGSIPPPSGNGRPKNGKSTLKGPAIRTKALARRRSAKASVREGSPSKRGLIQLAFDHALIVSHAYRRLCRHLDDPLRDVAFDLVPPRFTLAELQHLYEVVFGRTLNTRTFRRYLVERGFVTPTNPSTTKPPPKVATQLYRWNRPSRTA